MIPVVNLRSSYFSLSDSKKSETRITISVLNKDPKTENIQNNSYLL